MKKVMAGEKKKVNWDESETKISTFKREIDKEKKSKNQYKRKSKKINE